MINSYKIMFNFTNNRGVQIKAIMTYFISIRLTMCKSLTNTKCQQGHTARRVLNTLPGGVKIATITLRNKFLKGDGAEDMHALQPSNSICKHILKETYMRLFIATL